MRNGSRIPIALLVLTTVFCVGFRHFATRHAPTVDPTGADPRVVGPRLTLDALRDRGALRLAVPGGTRSLFLDRGVPLGFEYGLARRFARELDLELRVRVTSTAEAAADHLYDGTVDLAVLPWIGVQIDGAVRADPHRKANLASARDEPVYPRTGAFFVREDSPALVAALNRFVDRSRRDGTTKVLYERSFARRHDVSSPRISRYDEVIRRHARAAGLDWRFVAALIVRESRFDPNAVSDKGARGLMQVMPAAARDVGIDALDEPETNIRAGIRYLERLFELYPIPDGEDRRAMVLASYLLGPGHVRDARRIARERDIDPNRWDDGLDRTVVLLEERAWHREAEHGYAPGRQAVRYVEDVLQRYRLYRQMLPAD